MATSMAYVSDSQQLFVGNLPHNCTEHDLKELFSTFGKVIDLRINKKGQEYQLRPGREGVKIPNFGFIVFENEEAVQKVLKAKPIMLFGYHRLNCEQKKIRTKKDVKIRGLKDPNLTTNKCPIPAPTLNVPPDPEFPIQFGFFSQNSNGVTGPKKQISVISANDVEGDVEQTKQEINQKLLEKIDKLNVQLNEHNSLEMSELESIDLKFQETSNALKLEKEQYFQESMLKEQNEIQGVPTYFLFLEENQKDVYQAQMKFIKEKRSTLKVALEKSILELSRTLSNVGFNEVKEENTSLKKEMECPVCFEEMKPPTRIFHCTSGHLVCGGCKAKINTTKCVTCKEADIMGRATAMEQLARVIYQQN